MYLIPSLKVTIVPAYTTKYQKSRYSIITQTTFKTRVFPLKTWDNTSLNTP